MAICTETLSSGINLPARSVVLPSIMKGPPGKMRLLEASTAHQIFGRAGRPQFDTQGYVYVLAHEDDVRIARWKQKFDQIPEGTKDPGLLKAKKAMERKRPRRRDSEQYWNEPQFQKLVAAPAGKLHSRGPLPWRLLAYMLDASPEVDLIRKLVGKRLMDSKHLELGQRELDRMLLTLHRGGYVRLEPEPPGKDEAPPVPEQKKTPLVLEWNSAVGAGRSRPPPPPYRPVLAHPTAELAKLALFRSSQSALRHFPRQSTGHRQPCRAHAGVGERAGVAALGGPLRPRAQAGRVAARPAGHHPARRPVAQPWAGHDGRTGRAAQRRSGSAASHLR